MEQEASAASKRGRDNLSRMAAQHLQKIEVRQAGLDKSAVASSLAAREQELADAELARKLLEPSLRAESSLEDDESLALQLSAEEARHASERLNIEEMDELLARRLRAEEEERRSSMTTDRFLAATLQAEHGRAGQLLSRAEQLEDFLAAPLGSRPLPQSNDLMPETLRRIVAMTTTAKSGTPAGKSPACSTFRSAGSAIAAGA